MQIREMKKEDAEQLLGVYQRFAKEHVGLASRDIKAYKRLLRKKENMGWVAQDEKNSIIGYVTARFDKRTREARIVEIVIDPSKDSENTAIPLLKKAYNGLLEKKPAMIQTDSIRNPYYAKILPQLNFFEAESMGVFMYTILDVPKFLTEISPVFASRLKQLKHWNGLLQLKCEEHSLFLQKQQGNIERLVWTNQTSNFQITLSREILIKLLFGITDPIEVFEKGQLKTETDLKGKETRRILTTIFPKEQFLIMDFW